MRREEEERERDWKKKLNQKKIWKEKKSYIGEGVRRRREKNEKRSEEKVRKEENKEKQKISAREENEKRKKEKRDERN